MTKLSMRKTVLLVDQTNEIGMMIEKKNKILDSYAKFEVVVLSNELNYSNNIISKIRNYSPDILITTDLVGFDECTLTDNISYNLLDCKQIHLLLHENLVNEKYLSKELSIAMFFYCVGDAYYEYLNSKYPDLPYLKKLSNRWIENPKMFEFILQDVM